MSAPIHWLTSQMPHWLELARTEAGKCELTPHLPLHGCQGPSA